MTDSSAQAPQASVRARTRRRGPATPIERAAAGIVDGELRQGPTPKRGGAGAVRRACSPYWQDQVRAGRSSYPPPADTTPMVQCESGDRQCAGKIYPFYYGVGCTCEDCRQQQLLARERRFRDWCEGGDAGDAPHRDGREGGDSSNAPRVAQDLAMAEAAGVAQAKLATEDEAELRRQIDRYLAGEHVAELELRF